MSGFFTTTFRTRLLRAFFGAEAVNAPATLYASLVTTAPGVDGSGSVEVDYVGYARVAITNNTGAFTTDDAGELLIAGQITFAELPEAEDDIAQVGMALFEASSGGTPVAYFPAAKTLQALDTPYVAAGTAGLQFLNAA